MAQYSAAIEQENDELSKNPFAALFPSLEHAKDYIKSSKEGVYLQKSQDEIKLNRGQENLGRNDEYNQIQDSGQSEWKDKQFIVNDLLQTGFLFTVNSGKTKTNLTNYGNSPECVLLKGLHKELKEKKEDFLLSAENLNQAIMERLSSSHFTIVSFSQNRSQMVTSCYADETLLIKYLANSYRRLNDEFAVFKRKLKDLCILEELEALKSQCDSLIFSYAGSLLLSPDVFPTKDPHKQFLDLLLHPCDCKYLKEFLDGVIGQHESEEDLNEIFSPMMRHLLDENKSLSLMDPKKITILDLFLYFAKNKKLAKILVSCGSWFPPSCASMSSTAGLDYERMTIIGPILGTTTISYNPSEPSEFFLDPSRQDQIELEVVTNNCRRQLNLLCMKIHQLFRSLLEHKELQHQVLFWIGSCLHHNRKRAQLSIHTDFGSSLIQARDGFFINLSFIMLKLCEPFLNLNEKPSKLLKVNSSYCGISTKLVDIERSDTRVHLVQNLEESRVAQRTEDMDIIDVDGFRFKFVTDCFFITHVCLKLGYLKAARTYENLMKKLQKMNELYQDARGNSISSPELERIKIEFEADIRRQLSFKAHLLDPTLAESMIRFCAGTSYWLVQQLIAGKDFNDGKHRDLIPQELEDEVSPAMTIIPEHIVENVADCLIFMSHFGGEILQKSGNMLDEIMIFFSLFLGSSKRVNNPHLRAKLAEALAGLLPRKRSDDYGIAAVLGGRVFESNALMPQILPEALLKLFVDIEFTGHSMEFEQKFGYRHHMYAVLEYIWKIPSYNKVFFNLFEEGRVYYVEKSEFSTFPRFINLLLNDSTFLLDEALQHLCKIRELEREKQNENWGNLPRQVREEKERTLFQLGEMSRGYNIMANETVHVLSYITKDVTRPFASPCMVEQTASFLNYFLLHLVGPKRRDLKVKDFDKFHFKPSELVKNIAQILISLGSEKDFCIAIVSDGRSYTKDLYIQALQVLEQLRVPHDFLQKFIDLTEKFEQYAVEAKEEEENAPEPPEEFVDPILGTLMTEPVLLPSSKKILDKSTIARHLLSDPKDPFNRSPLTLDMVEPDVDLQQRILKWMDENGIRRPTRYTSKDCTG